MGQKGLGSGPGEFNLPHSIVVDSAGRVYVADRENGRIQVFSPTGQFLKQWKSMNSARPFAITLTPDNEFYVVEAGAKNDTPYSRALKVNAEGQILADWSGWGHYAGQLVCPHDVAVGNDGAIYVGEVCEGMRVQKFVPKK